MPDTTYKTPQSGTATIITYAYRDTDREGGKIEPVPVVRVNQNGQVVELEHDHAVRIRGWFG